MKISFGFTNPWAKSSLETELAEAKEALKVEITKVEELTKEIERYERRLVKVSNVSENRLAVLQVVMERLREDQERNNALRERILSVCTNPAGSCSAHAKEDKPGTPPEMPFRPFNPDKRLVKGCRVKLGQGKVEFSVLDITGHQVYIMHPDGRKWWEPKEAVKVVA